MGERPRLVKISDEMRRWCALIEDEIGQWPGVSRRPMFGMTAFYRERAIFAAVPRTRAVGTPWSILIKQPGGVRGRAGRVRTPGAGWVTFDLQGDEDVSRALARLEHAYRRARR